MWPFDKKKMHPLPQFPPGIIPTFNRFCEVLPNEEFEELKREVLKCLQDAAVDPRADVKLQRQISAACMTLIDAYEGADERNKALIVGALRYNALSEDALSEKSFAAGYYDDTKVLNHVMEAVGISGKFIRFGH